MRSFLSVVLALCIVFSMATFVASPLPEDSQDVVWVDDNYEPGVTTGFGITHFKTLSNGVYYVKPGGTLHLAAGDYDVCGIPHSLTILGEGSDVVTIDCYKSYMKIASEVGYFYMSGCALRNGSSHNITGYFYGTTEIIIEDCVISDATSTNSGIHFDVDAGSLDIEISGCEIKDNLGSGIYLSFINDAEGTVLIQGNTIEGNESGITITGGVDLGDDIDVDVFIYDNDVMNNQLYVPESSSGDDVKLSGMPLGYGLYLNHYGEGYLDVVVESNQFLTNELEGISVTRTYPSYDPPSSKTHIIGNSVVANKRVGINYREIEIYQPPKSSLGQDMYQQAIVLIEDNSINQNGSNGINLFSEEESSGTSSLSALGNGDVVQMSYVISKNEIALNTGNGIYVEGYNERLWYILNNNIHSNDNGVYNAYSYPHLYNNTIHDNMSNGVYEGYPLDASQGLIGQGIYHVHGTYINNIIVNNGKYGLGAVPPPASLEGTLGNSIMFLSNDVWNNGYKNYGYGIDDYTGLYGNISQDPLFAGPYDVHLTSGSPCVDTGSDLALAVLDDDKDDVSRPQGQGVEMGCYEFTLRNSFTPETFHPLVITQLSNANSLWTCIMGNLPDDPELMEEVEPMLEEVQAHMGNATSISNYIQANGELRQALSLMAEIDAMCECGCAN